MKKNVLLLIAVLCVSTKIQAQWTDYGSKISTSDDVGIGIASTIAKFHVVTQEDAIAWPAVINNTRNSSTISSYGIGLKLKHSWNHETWKWGGIASVQEDPWANNTGLALYANETEYVRIKHDGDVGVGTTNPKEKMHIEGNVLIDAFSLGNETGIFFREGFTSSNKYNLSILAYDHSGAHADGLSINGYDGVSFSTGSNARNERMRITVDGNVGIGTTTPDAELTVAGNIHSREVKVTINAGAGADFVFDEAYELPSLKEVEDFVTQNKHLPEIASEKEMQENGLQLAEMNIKLLQKIEELTLYTIAQEKKIDTQHQTLQEQEQRLQALIERFNIVEKQLKATE